MRRAHHAVGANSYVEDKETGEQKRPHHVDLKTGMYKGRQDSEARLRGSARSFLRATSGLNSGPLLLHHVRRNAPIVGD